MTIPFIDLRAQRQRLGGRIDEAIARVLDHGRFILGPEVAELESRLAAHAGVGHCVTCANGTDALQLVLMAEEIGSGDAVFMPAFTFVATAEAVRLVGATPVFCDVDAGTFNLDAESLEAAVPAAQESGLRPRMVIPVDLFGQSADYTAIGAVAERHGLSLLADAAQSFGATWSGRSSLGLADCGTTSFFPAKPLGCYGDGGSVFTDDADLAALLRSLRFHGKGGDKYDNVRIGLNSRLDTVQAAILLEKLEIFDEEIAARQRVADRYAAGLRATAAVLPEIRPEAKSVWAQYTIQVESRAAVIESCAATGVPTAVYYPVPLNRQTGYIDCPVAPAGVPVAEHLADHVLSLPMHPYLDAATQDRVVAAVKAAM